MRLDRSGREVEALRAHLTHDELARADRLLRRKHGRRFVVARAGLRLILGACLGLPPARIELEYEGHGKPRLAKIHAGGRRLGFNLSHSHELALLGVAVGRTVGVDVEHRRDIERAMKIADRFFSVAEKAALEALPETARAAGFLRCWTCKEAYIKAIGEGLARPLRSFDVDFTEGAPRLLRVEGAHEEPERWHLASIDVGPEYVATATMDGAIERVEVLDYVPGGAPA